MSAPSTHCHCRAPRPNLNVQTQIYDPRNRSAPPLIDEARMGSVEYQNCSGWWAPAEPSETEHKCCSKSTVDLDLTHRMSKGDRATWLGIFGACYPLPAAAFQRSLTVPGNERFRQFVRRVAAREKVTVVTLGSSVAMGQGSVGKPGSHHVSVEGPSTYRFVSWLRRRYPPGDHVQFKNLGASGTLSSFSLSHISKIEAEKPDLIIWDYAPNDYVAHFGVPGTDHAAVFRAVVESVVRRSLVMKSQPAFLFLSHHRPNPCTSSKSSSGNLEPDGAPCNATMFYAQQQVLIEPIARHYGAPLVSYRDAVQRSPEDSPSGPNLYRLNAHVAHIFWDTHQLIADTLAYAFVVAEEAKTPTHGSGTKSSTPELPPPKFEVEIVAQMQPCDGGWLTSFANGQAPPVSMGPGWEVVDHELVEKRGWQFSALRSPTWQGIANQTARQEDVQLLEPLTFEVRFGEDPRLSMTWLKSYENFGRALFWLDDDREAALQAYNWERKYRAGCRKYFDGYTAAGNTCWDHEAGLVPEPHLLDGRWEDRSSQSFTTTPAWSYQCRDGTTFLNQWAHNKTSGILVLLNQWAPKIPLFYCAPDSVGTRREGAFVSRNASAQGVHRISVAMIAPERGEAHGFKLMELHTC
tara:strand:- start:1076 stop:2974 length:1899 start_codon:yes stop_codon:yes gene_type:complete